MPLSLLDVVARADSFSYATDAAIASSSLTPTGTALRVGHTLVGFIRPALAPYLLAHPDVFLLSTPPPSPPTAAAAAAAAAPSIVIHPALATPADRTRAIEAVLLTWRNAIRGSDNSTLTFADADRQMFTCLKGWRNERYSVHGGREHGVLFDLERAATGLLGIRAYGCHLNGFVRSSSPTASGGEKICMWIARRSESKQTYPGMLDNLVGGGLATTTTPLDNIVKECGEEAGLDPQYVAKHITSVGVLTFFLDDAERGWVPDTEYVYDIELPESFVPQPVDGEVQAFHLLELSAVVERLRAGEFMNESALVVIDFLIRFGFVTPMNEPDYVEIVSRMHRRLAAPGPRFVTAA
ncbi:hypothetical protein HDU87_003106 [Geranomyces variabilis]|uniref:Nudix hydrolase domain-containing protein n=1 Tax=Geranomyces variabilis TaxID=109894 RepID=A0AAD5XSX3_9FUNG|nr:hypothetical protein HDU87_003106 [Geranomyces variabilis]